jgi:predicted TIM-barrel fold metal-dependent hydrolase
MSLTPERAIDVHHHYFSPEWYDYLTGHHANSYKFPGMTILKKWSPEADIESMDAGGVRTSILSTTTPGVWFGNLGDARRMARNMNDYGAELVRKHKGRFGLFGVLPLPDIDASLAEIAYVLDELKADGIGVLSSYDTKWLGDPHFAPVWAELNRRKAVVFSHATAPACCRDTVPGLMPWVVEFNTDTARSIIDLIETGTARRFPDITFIFSHAGGTIGALAGRYLRDQATQSILAATADPASKLGQLRSFFYDCAGSANFVNIQAMKMLVPMSRFVFGTDYPWDTPETINKGLADAGLSNEELAGLQYGNALPLFPRLRGA